MLPPRRATATSCYCHVVRATASHAAATPCYCHAVCATASHAAATPCYCHVTLLPCRARYCPCRYLRDVRGALQLRSLSSGMLVKEFVLPGVGSVTGFSGGCDVQLSHILFTFSIIDVIGRVQQLHVCAVCLQASAKTPSFSSHSHRLWSQVRSRTPMSVHQGVHSGRLKRNGNTLPLLLSPLPHACKC